MKTAYVQFRVRFSGSDDHKQLVVICLVLVTGGTFRSGWRVRAVLGRVCYACALPPPTASLTSLQRVEGCASEVTGFPHGAGRGLLTQRTGRWRGSQGQASSSSPGLPVGAALRAAGTGKAGCFLWTPEGADLLLSGRRREGGPGGKPSRGWGLQRGALGTAS